jgi:hypothetical protein
LEELHRSSFPEKFFESESNDRQLANRTVKKSVQQHRAVLTEYVKAELSTAYRSASFFFFAIVATDLSILSDAEIRTKDNKRVRVRGKHSNDRVTMTPTGA